MGVLRGRRPGWQQRFTLVKSLARIGQVRRRTYKFQTGARRLAGVLI
jgi:hypothetical protein